MELITTTILSADSSSIEFDVSSISEYDNFLAVFSVRSSTSAASSAFRIQLNNNSSSYAVTGTRAGSGTTLQKITNSTLAYIGEINASTSSADVFSVGHAYIFGHRSGEHKRITASCVTEGTSTTKYAQWTTGSWSNGADITSIKFSTDSGNLKQHSRITLYGLTGGSDGATTVS